MQWAVGASLPQGGAEGPPEICNFVLLRPTLAELCEHYSSDLITSQEECFDTFKPSASELVPC